MEKKQRRPKKIIPIEKGEEPMKEGGREDRPAVRRLVADERIGYP